MTTTTKQIFTGDPSQLNAAYKDIVQHVTRLEDKLHATSTKAVNLGSSIQQAAGAGIRQIAALGAQFLGLQAIVQAVNNDIQNTVRLQGEAAQAHRKLAIGQAEIILNTFGRDEKTVLKINEGAQQISAKYGLPEELVQKAAGRLMGAGVGPVEERMKALDVAAALTRHTPDALIPTALAIQQTQKITGLKEQEAASLMQSAGAAAYIGDPAMQARFLAQVMSGVVASSGGDKKLAAEQGMELGSWLTQAVGEERGETARTAGISLASQMEEYFTRGFEVQGPGGMKLRMKPPEDPGLPLDRLRYLQEHPAQARQFLEKASFERLFESTIRKTLLDPASDQNKLLADTEAAVKVDLPAMREQVRRLERMTPQLEVASSTAKGETIVEQSKGRLTRGAITDALRKDRDEAQIQAAPYRQYSPFEVGLANRVRDFGGWSFGDSAERFVEDIKFARGDILRGSRVTRPEDLGPEQRQVYDLMNRLIENGEKQLSELKAQTAELRARTNPPASVGPAANGEPGIHSERGNRMPSGRFSR